MKLCQWLAEHPRAYKPTTLKLAVYPNGEPTADLYHLEDFRVSTVSGPVVWLIPVSNTEGVQK